MAETPKNTPHVAGRVGPQGAEKVEKRDPRTGRYLKGHKGGPGNPKNRKIHAMRKALWAAIDARDVRAVVREMVRKAKAGDQVAAREILERYFGKARDVDGEERLKRIEERLGLRETGTEG